VIVLESMKMEIPVEAPRAGSVTEICVRRARRCRRETVAILA
jgi:biotin carboxyl carrier protein